MILWVVISVLVPVMTCFVGGKSSSCLKFLHRYTTFLGSIAFSPLIRHCWWVVGVLESYLPSDSCHEQSLADVPWISGVGGAPSRLNDNWRRRALGMYDNVRGCRLVVLVLNRCSKKSSYLLV